MDVIEQVGAFLGLVAFLGLAVLVLVYFQQARDVRRLREWAGRAPERAAAAAEQAAAAAARETGVADSDRSPGREGSLRERLGARLGVGSGARLGVGSGAQPRRWHLALIAAGAALLVAGVVTGAFGLVGSDGEGSGGSGGQGGNAVRPGQIEVAVLNGTATGTSPGVPGLADEAAKRVRRAGFKVGEVADAGSFVETVVMFRPGRRAEADRVATDLEAVLNEPDVERMPGDIRSASQGADVAVVIGQDNSQL